MYLSLQNLRHLQTQGNKSLSFVPILTILICFLHVSNAQVHNEFPQNYYLIQTAVPFLTIAPDGRSTGIGDIGVASDPDINSQHWNSGKYAFVEGKEGVALNYTPWGRNAIPGMNLGYLTGYYKINKKNTISTSFRFFSLGTIVITSIYGNPLYEIQAYELAVDGAYARRFTENFAGGVVIRYIHSDLTGGKQTAGGLEIKPGQSIAGDLGLYYQDNFLLGERNTEWALGLNISNVGTPVSYTADADKTPIPANLGLGGRFSYDINQNNTVSFLADLNKLMVPTSGVFDQDTATGDMIIIRGKASIS